jgi:hypothetical protein
MAQPRTSSKRKLNSLGGKPNSEGIFRQYHTTPFLENDESNQLGETKISTYILLNLKDTSSPALLVLVA